MSVASKRGNARGSKKSKGARARFSVRVKVDLPSLAVCSAAIIVVMSYLGLPTGAG